MTREIVGARGVRMRLRRADGAVYLERWGIQVSWLGGLLLHRMDAPDPGWDLHDHPWTFVTIPIVGGYWEARSPTRTAPGEAAWATRGGQRSDGAPRRIPGRVEHRRRFRPRMLRLDECHRIVDLARPTVWTVVVHGPRRRQWGFYLPAGWMHEHEYDATVRAQRRDMWNEDPATGQPSGRP